MTPTNYFQSKAFAVRAFREEHPEAENPEGAVDELIRQKVIKIGMPPLTRTQVVNGRYYTNPHRQAGSIKPYTVFYLTSLAIAILAGLCLGFIVGDDVPLITIIILSGLLFIAGVIGGIGAALDLAEVDT